MTLIYITCKDEEEARKISRYLLKKKLIACANFFPIASMYWWEGKINDDTEFLIIAKSEENKFHLITTEVKKIHSYEIPCIVQIPSKANEDYEHWALGVMK